MGQRDREFDRGREAGARRHQGRRPDLGTSWQSGGTYGSGHEDYDRSRSGPGSRDREEEFGRQDRGGRERSSGRYGWQHSPYGNRDIEGRGRFENSGYDEESGPYYGGGGLFGGGMGGYTGGGYLGGGLERSAMDDDERDLRTEGYAGYGGRRLASEEGYSRPGRREERGWWDRMTDEVSSWFDADDRQERESYRGRGPRGYSRSDVRIEEDINDRLTEDHHLDASDIEVEVAGGEVVLSGHVSSRYEKRRAEDIAEDVSGVTNVENRIRVKRANAGQTSGAFVADTETTGPTDPGATIRSVEVPNNRGRSAGNA